ncbi:histone H1-like isoform X1 [Scyliorhinus canicula]|uniref:histone H1-like isoform X1 n=1 Tax=Scyliorhinus canicula TaxID=7830 RepID=UPI0018F36D55|nr:histone H1-like isoform X1 [Scyliorhinus canicula]
MSESAAAETAPPAAAPVKAVKKQKKAVLRKKPEGPGLGELIHKIVADSGDRKGVSLQAIKKQLWSKGVDVDKRGYQIKQSVKRSVDNGSLAQVKGTGASGSFKIVKKTTGGKVIKTGAGKKPLVKKAAAKKSPKKAAPKKPAAKKAAAKKTPKKPAAKKSPKKAAAKKSPKKAAPKNAAAPKKSAKKAAPEKSSVKKIKGGIKQTKSRVKPKVKKPAKK